MNTYVPGITVKANMLITFLDTVVIFALEFKAFLVVVYIITIQKFYNLLKVLLF